jgi:hypothetical protein
MSGDTGFIRQEMDSTTDDTCPRAVIPGDAGIHWLHVIDE